MNKLLIVDGHNLLFQMFFGMPSRIKNKDGKSIQGTLGFVGALIKIIKSKEYIRKFYKQHDLVNAIKEYKKKAKAKKGTYQLADFLK